MIRIILITQTHIQKEKFKNVVIDINRNIFNIIMGHGFYAYLMAGIRTTFKQLFEDLYETDPEELVNIIKEVDDFVLSVTSAGYRDVRKYRIKDFYAEVIVDQDEEVEKDEENEENNYGTWFLEPLQKALIRNNKFEPTLYICRTEISTSYLDPDDITPIDEQNITEVKETLNKYVEEKKLKNSHVDLYLKAEHCCGFEF